MLRIDRDAQGFVALECPTLADCSITERYDLQEFIFNSPSIFFKEIGQDLFLIGKEVVASKNVQDRIDILAVDKEGACVIIELKRGNHKLHMLQAISYAGMISEWAYEELLALMDEERQEALSEFLEVDREEINRRQRIILLAEAYDYSLLVAAKWLSEQYGVDLTCCRLAVAKDQDSSSEYLVCSNVHPPPELAEQAVQRGRKGASKIVGKWADWATALSVVSNQALVDYFQKELAAGRENYLPKRILRYRSGGKRHWFVAARRRNAYVWQQGRFANDQNYWQSRLSKEADVKPVKNDHCLRLFLHTAGDFQAFLDAVTGSLTTTQWLVSEDEPDDLDATLAE